MAKLTIPEEEYMANGHMGCLGCGGTLAMRYVLKALGPRTIVSVPACCWAIMGGVFPNSCLKVPMLNTAFEVTGASVSGIAAALKVRGITDINVVGFAGDGGTFDIGIQALSGAVERGHNFIYCCYDNEAYMNTGIQRSSSTPIGAWTTTTPVGKLGIWEQSPKKNMVEIMVAHQIPYTAIASIGYPEDLIKKVTKAMKIKGPKYIQIYAPCPTGWRSMPSKTVELGKLAVQTCVYPIFEVENGVYNISRKPSGAPVLENGKFITKGRAKQTVRDYLGMQGRFRHLPETVVNQIEERVNSDWKHLLRLEAFTQESSDLCAAGENE